eukprot:TRINITY_DN2013_c0_g1_i1.p1 TRINITY_DN2013_c0_g1~~TRINITY_DN2013_c0_g1_i1.p1  ORF type:complete len:347 (+),score=130.33 TRINITY_DN2013_c0_g1_i1:89-1129(+)
MEVVRGGSADREKDLLLKSLIMSMGPSLASKSDEFIDERVDKLKKQEKAIAKLLQKEGDEAGMALMAKVFHEDEVARADKIMLLKTWTRVLCPRKNFCWLKSFPREFLAVMLGMVDPDWQDALPTGSKDVLCCYVTSWVSNYHPPEARRRGRKRAAEEAEAEAKAASASKRPKLAAEASATQARKAAPKAAAAKVKADNKAKLAGAQKASTAALLKKPATLPPRDQEPTLPPPASDADSHHSSWIAPTTAATEDAEALPYAEESMDDVPAPEEPPADDSKYTAEEVNEVVTSIRRRLQFGESQVATLQELSTVFEIEPPLVLEAARMMHRHADLLLDESIGVLYLV